MRVATGVDIIDLEQAHATLHDPKQLQRMLHPGDITRHTAEHIAGRMALKEAAIKALSLSADDWLEIQIHTAVSGKPVLSLTRQVAGLISVDGSVSHHGDTVVGFVVALFDDENK